MPTPLPPAPRLLYGVCGYPLAQSLSPALHTWAFARLAHPGAYLAWPQPQQALAAFISAVRCLPVAGVSLTIPHKETVMGLLDGISATAKAIGAVNTLLWRDGALWGENTDLAGFLAPLQGPSRAGGRPLAGTALVLGGGGAARAVLAGLTALRVPRIVVALRDTAKGAELAADFSCALIPWQERLAVLPPPGDNMWVINTTPLGMRGKAEQETPYPVDTLRAVGKAAQAPDRCLAYDLVYNPLQTRFLADAAACGWAVQDGLDMFVAQGAAQTALWTGREWSPDMPQEARALLLSLPGATGQQDADR